MALTLHRFNTFGQTISHLFTLISLSVKQIIKPSLPASEGRLQTVEMKWQKHIYHDKEIF